MTHFSSGEENVGRKVGAFTCKVWCIAGISQLTATPMHWMCLGEEDLDSVLKDASKETERAAGVRYSPSFVGVF